MTRRRTALTWVLFLAATCGAAFGMECPADLDTVLARYAVERGGEAVERQVALRIRSHHHEGRWNPTFDYRVMKPGYMLMTAVYDDGDVIVEGFDGEVAWEKWGEELKVVTGAARRGLQQGAQSPVHLYGLHLLESLGATVSLEGCQELAERSYVVVKAVSRFGTDIDYFVALDTFRLERARTRRPLHPTQDPTEITIEERWSDFRWVEGVLHPFGYSQWNVETGERLSWLEVQSIEADAEATWATFRMPEE